MKKNESILVGFWLRLVADILDAIILGIFGFLLTLPFNNLFYQIGENGLWIGFIIAFLYTGILQSYIGKGQSLAKKILKIQVLTTDGNYLSLHKSFLRYTIIALIFYNSWIWLALTSLFPFLNNILLGSIYTYLILILILSVIIMIAFHPQKRGLHDIIAGSIVVKFGLYDEKKINELHSISKQNMAYLLVGISSLLLIIGSILLINNNEDSYVLIDELSTLQKKIGEDTKLTNIQVLQNTFTDKYDKKTESIFIGGFISIDFYDNDDLCQQEKKKIVNIIIENYSHIDECEFINIQIRTGYNIGIWKYYLKKNERFTTPGFSLIQSFQ